MPPQMPNIKMPPWLNQYQEKLDLWTEKAVRSLLEVACWFGKGKEIAANNYALGMQHQKTGDFSDAVMRFKMVTWIEPKNIQAWYHLGNSFAALGKKPNAAMAYRQVLVLKPDHEEAAYMLAMARGKKSGAADMPRTIPMALALAHFEGQALAYNKQQLEIYGYQGHKQIVAAIRSQIAQGRMDHKMLDLGVGTGLCGPLVRDIASQLIGVDISEKMLIEARQLKDGSGNKIYDALYKRDLRDFLREAQPGSYDIVIAADVLSYVGDLTDSMAQIARVLSPGGIVALTVSKGADAGMVFAPDEGRFIYSRDYLQQLAQANGLTVKTCEETQAYASYAMWLGVFKK